MHIAGDRWISLQSQTLIYAGLHPGDSILEHDRPGGFHPEHSGRFLASSFPSLVALHGAEYAAIGKSPTRIIPSADAIRSILSRP